MTETLAHKPTQIPGFYLEDLDWELLLYNMADTRVFYCNVTASLLWHLATGERTVGEIVDLLSAAYADSASRAQIQTDVIQTLTLLHEHGALSLT